MTDHVRAEARQENGGAWPVAIAVSLFLLAGSGVVLFHPDVFGHAVGSVVGTIGLWALLPGLALLLVAIAAWSVSASSARGESDRRPAARIAMFAFIASEAMFFAGFFAAYLSFAINPEIAGLTTWPPAAMRPVDPWGGPLLNTLLLLASGAAVAFAHGSFLKDRRTETIGGLAIAVLLGLAFLALQLREFRLANQAFDDGVYPSIFFLATGFHGLHVLIGATLLTICLVRILRGERASDGRFMFDGSAWYWHFVDAVWLLLFAIFYAWAG